jgi:predicted Zn finger-like uncharacterized protein
MILNCPECNARFLVADNLIPEAGRTVRCGACSHQWHVTRDVAPEEVAVAEAAPPPAEEEAPVFPENIAPASNVPAIKKREIPLKPFKIAVPALAACWALLAAITYFPNGMKLPVLKSLYAAAGVSPTDGLMFADVHMTPEKGEVRTKYIVSGSVVNQAPVARLLPEVYVALNDKKGNELWGRVYPVNVTLKAGEVYPFRIENVETGLADSVATMVLDLGNPLALAVR